MPTYPQATPAGGNHIGSVSIDGANVDDTSGGVITTDFSHHETHEGDAFCCHYSQTTPTNIGEMTIIAFTTPDTTKWVHMLAEASSTAASTFTVYEISDLDLGEGSNLAIYNRNRNSSNTSTVWNLAATPAQGTATSFSVAQASGATLSTANPIYQKYLGAGVAGADTSGDTRDVHEFILKQNTQYAWVVANTTNDDNTHNIILNWYEHTNTA